MTTATNPNEIRRNLSLLATKMIASRDYSTKVIGETIRSDLTGIRKRVIDPISLYSDAVNELMANIDFSSGRFNDALEYGKTIYTGMFPSGVDTPGYDTLAPMFVHFFSTDGVISRKCFNTIFFNLFSDPMDYMKWFGCLTTQRRFEDYEAPLVRYATLARSLYADEDMFTANIIRVTLRMVGEIVPEDIYVEEAKRVEHMAGLYDVDEALILKAEQQISTAKEVIDRSRNMLSELDSKAKIVSTVADSAVSRVQEVCSSEIDLAESRLNTLSADMQQAYDAFLDTEQKKIAYEKQQLIDAVVTESEHRLNELKKTASQVISTAKLELANLNRESGVIAAKIEAEVRDSEKLNAMLSSQSDHEELMKKIDKLMVLNDRNIDALVSIAEQNADMRTPALNSAGADAVAYTGRGDRVAFVPAQPATEDIDPYTIPPINPFFDETVPFKDRYAYATEAKAKMEQNGAHFHKMFDDVLMAVIENANPYLIGPSGCGKTYMVGQIAKILNMEFIDIGYINEEYDILGFQTANGGYSRPNFYRCYKYGKIAFCDELDNGNSRATVKLNSFLSNTTDAYYNFPNGERVQRHNNFRIIGAGNTAGNGADSIYNTRERIEESVQQRFTPIYIGYDNEVERAILGDNTDWFAFVELFRAATDAWSRTSHSEAPGIITTRDVTRIRRYLDNQSFSPDKILDYEFIQTKDESYLAFLGKYIAEHIGADSPADAIAKAFVKKVADIRSGGHK